MKNKNKTVDEINLSLNSKLFYFQILQEDTSGWDENIPFAYECENREQAVNYAYFLSKYLKTKIRMCDNEYYESNSGTYILAKF